MLYSDRSGRLLEPGSRSLQSGAQDWGKPGVEQGVIRWDSDPKLLDQGVAASPTICPGFHWGGSSSNHD